MKIEYKTPKGSKLSFDGQYATVNGNGPFNVSDIRPDGLLIVMGGKDTLCPWDHPSTMERADAAYRAWNHERFQAEEEKIEAAIPGYLAVKAAHEAFKTALDRNYEYTERGLRTSIYSGDDGNPDAAQKVLEELVQKFPAAAKYLKWSSRDASSNMGYAQRCAANALLSGKSLDECEQIAVQF